MIDNEIVTANAKVFPLIEDTPSSEPLFTDRDSQLEIDARKEGDTLMNQRHHHNPLLKH